MRRLLCAVLLLAALVLPAPAQADWSGAHVVEEHIAVLTQNVRSLPLMPQAHVVADVRADARSADVILWQEIGPARYKRAVRSLGPAWHTYGLYTAEPISWRADRFTLLGYGAMVLNRGVRRLTPVHHVTWVRLRDRVTGFVFVVNDAHYVNAFPPRARVTRARLRASMFWAGYRRQERLVARWVRAGDTVIGGGDYNLHSAAMFGTVAGVRSRQLFAAHAKDHLWVITGLPVRARLSTLPRWSDHPGRRARLTFAVPVL